MASYLETVREWFRARLDAPGGLSTPEGATLGLQVLAIWRSRMIAQALRNQEGGCVLGGPFAGMVYVETATEGALAPRLVGTYEDELHPHLAAALAADPEVILDIGCAEGYYAVGLARLAPHAEVYAHDTAPAALEACRRMAELNGVEARLRTGGLFHPEDFQAFADRRCLVIVDIEGAEDDLLRPDLAPALAGMRLIVETHDVYRPGVLDRVRARFEATHAITVVHPGPKTAPLPEILRNRSHLDQLLAVWEFRAAPTPWLVMTPKRSV
ncbi:MAG: methyltransferase domain-containing protein [Phenylobacterium sp.]|uniref:methyltransferase domain-containing protein n=1 Tax=Phenylobacterium sp. TaxID=1871053 RepID=UPI0025DE3603|nr:methyltransferase domain-containing protein [Phenylobacterium sp.]MCA6297847.1 methyltransferase domain-containing protein [Phenylobacterium sp.]